MLRWLPIIFAVGTPGLITAAELQPDEEEDQLYAQAPAFTVQRRDKESKFQPCSRCHEEGDTDPEPRRLKTRHTKKIDHGGNRFWCLTCHDGDNMDFLRNSRNEQVGFERSYLICGSCHADRQRDWYFGGHGKRVSGWNGDRVILACTQCHDPHSPAQEPRKPRPPPPVRIGLERQEHHAPATHQLWK